jgi:hypothetical protein
LWSPSSRWPEARAARRRLHREHLFQELRRGDLVFAVGASFGGVLRIGEGVLCAAEKLQLEVDLSGRSWPTTAFTSVSGATRIFGPGEDQHSTLDALRRFRHGFLGSARVEPAWNNGRKCGPTNEPPINAMFSHPRMFDGVSFTRRASEVQMA